MMRRTRGQEGFTLIELTVALVAGLVVALGIMGLSKDATHTFHEEMRSSAAEANLRTAMDRLRADLARAGYMSTGNISTDPLIARAPGETNPIPSTLLGLGRLTSIYLDSGGVATTAPLPLSAAQNIPLNPDAIDIAGNMTSTDQFEVSVIQAGASVCGGARIFLNTLSPSFLRNFATGGLAEVNNTFQPVAGSAGQFIVRLVDKTGHSQFLTTCAGQPAAGAQGTQIYLDIAAAPPLRMSRDIGNVGGLAGYGSGSLVNPVQIVRWQLLQATAEPAQYAPLGGQPLVPNVVDPTKYDLVRSYVDAATGNPIAATTEVVAEYAVDLKFAFAVDAGTSGLLPNMQIFPFGNPNNPLWAPNILGNPALLGQPDPARIRSVRVRLVTRAAEPDRTLNVAVPNPNGQPFMYRYCVQPPAPTGCDPVNTAGILQYARARTLTAEVALPNQSRNYY
jgi:prepilin-type N-terminal cleavage/methylation domain-containing protein